MKPKYITDQALLKDLSIGKDMAIKELYVRYHEGLVKWIVSKGGLEADAEDVFQEGVLILFEKSKDLDFCLTASIGTYLFAICKNLWMKKINSNDRSSTQLWENDWIEDVQKPYLEADIDNLHQKEKDFNSMYEALDLLGSPCNELLKAFYIDGQSMVELSKKFGYTNAENAKTQKYKCLNRLKKIFFERNN